jgi:hypothetical protein
VFVERNHTQKHFALNKMPMQLPQKDDVASLWMHYMRSGAFEAAWACSYAMLQARAGKPCWHLPRHQQNIWDGSLLQGKRVLVRCYHGLGDTLQFIRYAPLLKAVATEVIVWAQPSLLPLLKTVQGIDRLLPLHNGTSEVEYDVDVEIMELPHIFRTTIDTIPSPASYIEVAPMPLSNDLQTFSIGLVWQAGNWDQRRSIPFPQLAPLAAVKGVQLYILQGDAPAAGWQEGFGIYPGAFDLYSYARVLRGINLLITVDSMPAHLAGAQGTPVWNLLHAEADWRWMEHREDSPWYPSMRLFRQQQQGNWERVIKKVVAALEQQLGK